MVTWSPITKVCLNSDKFLGNRKSPPSNVLICTVERRRNTSAGGVQSGRQREKRAFTTVIWCILRANIYCVCSLEETASGQMKFVCVPILFAAHSLIYLAENARPRAHTHIIYFTCRYQTTMLVPQQC